LHNPNDSEDDWEADSESGIELDNGTEDTETPLQQGVSVTPNDPRLLPPTQSSKTQAEKVLMMVNKMETRRNKAIMIQ